MTTQKRAKKVLIVDLNKKDSDVKSFPDLYEYVGGVGLGLKLLSMYSERDPVIFSVGPLNGYFPYASKTSVVLRSNGVVEDIYLGGSLSFRIKFSGVDSIMFLGEAKEQTTLCLTDGAADFFENGKDVNSLGLPGKRSTVIYDQTLFSDPKVTLDGYFVPPENFLENKFVKKNIQGMVVTGTKTTKIDDLDKYNELYNKLLLRSQEMIVDKSDKPSCSGCPMSCSQSQIGEIGGNVLVHSLCACSFSTKIYSDVGTVFSCLNVLGYDYSHEDIENLPKIVDKVLKELNE